MGQFVRHDDLVVRGDNVVAVNGRSGRMRLLTTEQVRQRLGYAHARHIYWLVEQGYLPLRKFGRELVFLESDLTEYQRIRGF